MLFSIVDDWKQFLSPDDETRLNNILKNVSKHRNAYRASKDVKMAQIWCALLELRKESQLLHKRLNKMESVFEGISDRMKKENLEEKEILESLEKF